MINKIKNYIVYGISAFLATLGIYIWSMKVKKQSDLNKTDKSIENNNKTIEDTEKKIEDVNETKTEITKSIEVKEKKIEELKEEIKSVSVEPIEDVPTAKENIIKKTKRRGRRPNKNNKTTTIKTDK